MFSNVALYGQIIVGILACSIARAARAPIDGKAEKAGISSALDFVAMQPFDQFRQRLH